MNTQVNDIKQKKDQYFRFQVLQGEADSTGSIKKTKSVGMAYLKEGQNTITLRLWTFVHEKFYIIANRNDASKYLIMTREPNKNLAAKNKYFWNIVGSGTADTSHGIIKLDFDLFSKVVYVNMHPETSAFSVSLPEPDFGDTAAA